MKHRYIRNVARLTLCTEQCTGCGMCLNVCPHAVFSMNNGKAEIIDKDSCMECGACWMNCAFGAIEVVSGTGCALAIMNGKRTGGEPNCDCCC